MMKVVKSLNSRQKEVQKVHLENEKRVLRQLQQVYKQASIDCEQKIRELNSRTDMQNLQSIIYQKQYQEALKKQFDGILDNLQNNQFTSIAEYLGKSYEDGFFGTLYDLQGQGIPLIFPINQDEVTKALQNDTKLNKGLYKALGEDVDYLKKSIKAELSRGIANGSSWLDVAQHIAKGMNSPFDKALNRSKLIARTEGHRVQNQSTLDCVKRAKAKGANIVKQWDSTLDGRTRPEHVNADGQVREVDEDFEVGGEKMKAPGVGGSPRNVCNCRCALLQRAKWNLSQKEYTKMNGDTNELVKIQSKGYNDFKEQAKDVVRKQELSSGWKGINYTQNYKTKKEAIEALENKHGIKFSDSRKYPLNEKLACDMVSWIDAFAQEYSTFNQKNPVKLPLISCKPASKMKGKLGCFTYYSYSNNPVEIALNGAYHSDLSVYEDYIKRSVGSKWSIANATTHKTIVHEYGHYVSNAMTKISDDKGWESKFIQECVDEYKKTNSNYELNTYIGLKDALSEYGTTSSSECFAEAFAEFYGGQNPRDFAIIFGTKLDALLKGVK